MSEWKNYCIGDLCSTISNTYNGSDDKVVLINTSDVLDGKILNHNFVENKNLKGQFKKTFIKNDILYSEIRPANKRFAFIDFDKTNNYIVSTKLMVLRPDTTKVLPSFLFSILKSQTVIDELQHLAETRSGTFPQITFSSELAPMKVLLPNLDMQAKIVSILNSIEEKISTNTAINNNLEQQAQAIFKSWFVDFEPFGGTMPNDWCVGCLSDIATITMGQSPSGSSYNENKMGTLFFQGRAEFGYRYPKDRLYTTEPKRIAKANDILISVRAPVGDINIALKECCIGRGLAAIEPKNRYNSFVLYSVFNLKKQLNIFNGEGTVFGSINKDSLNDIKTLIPSKGIIKNFEKIVSPMDNLIKYNCIQNEQLAQLRDTLLPKLMSGEIDVSEVDISTNKLLFSILVFEHLYIKIVILIGVTINTMTIFTSNIIKFKLKKSFTFDN